MFLGYARRHHIGLLALFVALGGTSYAAVKLPRNSVGTAQIKSHAVTTSKLSTSTVKAGNILVLVSGTFTATCTGGGGCTYEVGAKLDGAPVPNVDTSVASSANQATPRTVTLANIVPASAGAHSITLFHDTTGTNLASGTPSDDTRIGAIAIG